MNLDPKNYHYLAILIDSIDVVIKSKPPLLFKDAFNVQVLILGGLDL